MRIRLRESNNEKEFRKLYEEYYAPFCLYAKRFINDMTVCEDLVSDVFVSLWDKRDSIELKKETAMNGTTMSSVKSSLPSMPQRQTVYIL